MKDNWYKRLIALLCMALVLACCASLALAEGDDGTQQECSHNPGTGRVKNSVSATCTAAGYEVWEIACTKCGVVINEWRQETSPAKGHSYITDNIPGECGSRQQLRCTTCGHTEPPTGDGNHNWTSKSYTASSCNEQSYTYQECTKCHTTKDYVYGSVGNHTYTKKPVVHIRDATCSQTGEDQQTCDCGQKTKSIPIAKTAHSYGSTQSIAGSCTTKAKTVQYCTVCNDEKVISTGDYAHNYVTTDTVEADCTTAGYRETRCTKCGYLKMGQPVPALGHSAGYWQSDASGHWRNCTRCQIELNRSNGHTGSAKDSYCTTKSYCTVCGYTIKAAGKHRASVAQASGSGATHNLVCPDCGYVTGTAGHSLTVIGGDCTNGKRCTVCGETTGGGSHSMPSSWTGNGGVHVRRCTVSGCSYTVSEDHAWGDWYVAYPATTTSTGTEATKCTKCSSTRTRAIPKLTGSASATPAPTTPADSSSGAKETATPASGTTAAPAATDAPAQGVLGSLFGSLFGSSTQETTPVPAESGEQGTPVTAMEANVPKSIPAVERGQTCAALGRECTWKNFVQNGVLVHICAVCGNVTTELLFDVNAGEQPIFYALANFTATGATQPGELILRAANLHDGAENPNEAFAVFTVAWEQDGVAQELTETLTVSVPMAIGESVDGELSVPTESFKLVRVHVAADDGIFEERAEVEYTYENGILTFQMDEATLYLLVPAEAA